MKRFFGIGMLIGAVFLGGTLTAQVNKKAQKKYDKALKVLNQDWNKSLELINAALKIDDQFPAAYTTRGRIYSGQGKDSLAYVEFNKALAIDSGFTAAWQGTAEALGRERAWMAVALAYTRALGHDSTNPDLYFSRANAQIRNKKAIDAISDYSEAIALDSTKYKYFYRRGIANRTQGYNYAAIEDFDQAIKLAPGVMEPRKERVRANLELPDVAAVREDLKYLSAMRANDREMDYFRGKAYFSIGDVDDAIRAYDAALKKDPDYMEAYLGRSLAKVDKDDREGAIADLSDVLRLTPNNASIYMFRGRLKFERSDHAAALGDFDEAVRLDSTFAEAFYLRAFTHSHLEDKE
ncbi:MAG: tetratricopeptide repeat protein, partial [Bacteroidota bacterium]